MKGQGMTTGLSGGSQRIETEDRGQVKEESQQLEQKVEGGRIIVKIDPPFQAMRDGLELAPNGCALWTRRDGSKWVLFPDGSKHEPEKVGFTADAWRTARTLNTGSATPPPTEA